MGLAITYKTGCFEMAGIAMRAGKQPRQRQVNLRPLVDAGWSTTELQDCAPERDGADNSGGGTHLNGTRKQGGGVSIQHDG